MFKSGSCAEFESCLYSRGVSQATDWHGSDDILGV